MSFDSSADVGMSLKLNANDLIVTPSKFWVVYGLTTRPDLSSKIVAAVPAPPPDAFIFLVVFAIKSETPNDFWPSKPILCPTMF